MMRHAPLALLLLALGGCSSLDPYTREGVWRPRGANEANLRLHVADPLTLEHGIDDPRSDGQASVAAIRRLRTDRLHPLAAASVARMQATGTAGAAPSSAGASDGGR
jgi:hypothetical protein